ncbi:MAG: NrtA/SsuA/CpmA family ABC transporter substrate-binding protein [Deltaproteobacteria bacterium]|nr:NrtA/SsuA/CpmA family ABC transporter substrate-binding protein [Deltaproteobacteria bacterium]
MPQNQASFRKRRILAGIAIAALALTAGAYFFVAGGPDRKPAGPPERVTLACTTITDTALAVVAQVQGYAREEGLEVTIRRHPYGKLALQEVLEGKADFATVAETPVMFAILKGQKIAIVATIQSTNRVNAIVARRDRGIDRVADLRGRKIAVTLGTTMDYFLDALLSTQGISRKEVSLVDLPAEEIPAALARGDVDAGSLAHPYNVVAEKSLAGRGITFQSRDIYTAIYNIVATQAFIGQNPGKVVKLLRALTRAEAFVSRYPAAAQKIVADFCGLELPLVRDGWAGNNFGVTLDQSLLLELENEARWAIRNRLTGGATKLPNYLDFIYLEGLTSVKPKAVNILK